MGTSWAAFRHSGLAVFPLLCACATANWRSSDALRGPAERIVRAQLARAEPAPELYAADGLLTAFARGERVRLKVQLLVAGGQQFRFTALGPHGAAVWLVASDGNELTGFDVGRGRGLSAPATRAGFAELAAGLDVGVPLPEWLGLMSNRLSVPAEAVAYPRPHGQTAWCWSVAAGGGTAAGAASPQEAKEVQALADEAGRIVALRVLLADGGEVQASFLPSSAPKAPAVVKEVDVRVANKSGQATSTMSLSLSNVVLSPTLQTASPFRVGP